MKATCLLMFLTMLALSACGTPPSDTASLHELPVDTLSVVFSIGEELGDSTRTFGIIQDALILQNGNIVVLDRQVACLKVFSPSGEYIRQVGRRGGGPGELSMPWELLAMPDGRLLVLEMMKQGFVVFDDSLRLVEEISHWTQNPPLMSTAMSDSTFAAYKIDVDMVGEQLVMNRRIAVYRVGERDFDTVLRGDSITATMNQLMENPSMFVTELLDAYCLGGDGAGTVYFAEKSGESYKVLGWDAGGNQVFEAGLDLRPVPKTPEEIQEEKDYMNRFIQGMGGGMPFDFQPEPNRNMVAGLGVDSQGHVWVQRGTMAAPFFDIFDGQGNLLRHAVFPVEGWSWTFHISPEGMLAWEADPASGFQQLYMLE